MSNYLPISLPNTLLALVTELFVPSDTPDESLIKLVITLPSENVNIRDFAAYFSLIDRIYGRLAEKGFYSYAHRRDEQLRYSQIKHGSWQIVFSRALYTGDVTRLILLFLFLKHLPHVRMESAEAAHRLITGYGYHTDRELARENRKQLKLWMPQDASLKALDAKHFNQLVALLDGLYALEASNLLSPIRFSIGYVSDIRLVLVFSSS